MNTRRQWHSGPPPSIGWWPASDAMLEGFYRWWDGNCWSIGAHSHYSAAAAGEIANIKQDPLHEVLWRHWIDT